MDIQNTIMGTVIIIICFLPIILITVRRKQREKQKFIELQNIAQQNGSNINDFEFCGDFTIGLDTVNSKVFFLNSGEKADSQQIDLLEIKDVYADNKSRIMSADNESISILKTIDLCFNPQNKTQPTIKLSLYDDSVNPQLGDELKFGEKWSHKLNEHIKSKK